MSTTNNVVSIPLSLPSSDPVVQARIELNARLREFGRPPELDGLSRDLERYFYSMVDSLVADLAALDLPSSLAVLAAAGTFSATVETYAEVCLEDAEAAAVPSPAARE